MKLRLTLALSLLGLAACSVYDPALMTQGLAGVPERPPASTSKSTDDVEAIFAFRNISLDQSGDRWRRFGLDLDGMNTSSIEDEAECVAANGRPTLDGDKGIDNSFGQNVLPTVVGLISCLEDNIALNQGRGFGTVLLRLREWNGTPNDAKVDVSVVSSVDGTSADEVTGFEWGGPDGATLKLPGANEDAPAPAWDGDDVFYVDPGSLVAGDIRYPLVWKTDAYISNGRVVLPVDTATTFVFLTGPGSFWLSLDGYLIADISEDGETLEKGLLAGRFSAGELVATLKPLGICDSGFRGSVTSLLTDNLDLRIDPTLGSPDEQCTASSVAFSFQGIRARIAETIAPVELPIPDPCAGDGSQSGPEPAFDRCCRSVELETPSLLPADCTLEDLQQYTDLPNPIPVPLEEGF
ncbi:MAG: hypothetical protein AMJ63_05245 [Myxococcales bacterium SG8_38_1]|jgi:hypothetical protein|nr:MAG: hypothetical protein AMJ63_05245 [Myxococcales bacterium SG8_38_1]